MPQKFTLISKGYQSYGMNDRVSGHMPDSDILANDIIENLEAAVGSFKEIMGSHQREGRIIDRSLFLTPLSIEGFSGHPVVGRPPGRADCRVLQLFPSGSCG